MPLLWPATTLLVGPFADWVLGHRPRLPRSGTQPTPDLARERATGRPAMIFSEGTPAQGPTPHWGIRGHKPEPGMVE